LRYRSGLRRNGARLQTSKAGFPTKGAAQSALQELVRTFMVDVGVHSLTVGEYLETWLAGKHALKPKTMALYQDLTRLYLVPNLGGIRLLELRAHHLDRMYSAIALGRRGRPLSPSTIRRVHAVLRSALNTAVKRRLIPYNSANHIELAPENPKRPKPWTPEQCQIFLKHASDTNDRLGSLYQLLLVTGMRRGEAIGLRWEDVDFEGKTLSVVQQITEVHGRGVIGTPKTKRGTRVIPIDVGSVAMLQRQKETQDLERSAWGPAWNDAGLVFTREDGRPLRPEYATRHFQALSRATGLPVIRLHDLRHSNASLALEAGVEMKVVSERLGHSQISVTADLYTHVNERVGRAAAEKIAGVLNASATTVPAASLQQTSENGPQEGRDRECIGERARPPPAFPLVRGLVRLSQQSAPGGIRTPNLLIRKQSGPHPPCAGIGLNRP
jgi:integrase